jgi:hypothetical protein
LLKAHINNGVYNDSRKETAFCSHEIAGRRFQLQILGGKVLAGYRCEEDVVLFQTGKGRDG